MGYASKTGGRAHQHRRQPLFFAIPKLDENTVRLMVPISGHDESS